MTKAANTVQEALRLFANKVGSREVFDEASVALDAGCDYKVTITCTEKAGGFVVAMHRSQAERIDHWSFIKLEHGEWSPPPSAASASSSETGQQENGNG
jgi:hypothetical protein